MVSFTGDAGIDGDNEIISRTIKDLYKTKESTLRLMIGPHFGG